MAGFIGQWGPRQEQLHPRGFHGRWIRKFNVPQLLPRVLAAMDRTFRPHEPFHSDGQAAQYLQNKASPTRFKNGSDYRRLMVDWDEANAHLQMGDIDPSTQRYIDMMEENKVTLEDDLILTQVFTPDAIGLTPQQMAEEHGDFDGLLGAVVADKGYSATHIGTSPQMGPGKIQMAIAVPKGTQVIIPSRAHNDRAVFLDRDQNLLITRVDRNPTTGEYYIMAAVLPKQKNEPNVPNLEAARGTGATPEQREAKIGAPVAPNDQAARAGQRPPMGAGGQVTQEDVARQAESPPAQAPPPQAAPQPAPAPSSPAQGQGPAPRNEPIHRDSVGGTGGAEGRAPEEIATAPPEAPAATPAPATPAAPPSPQQEHLDRARQRAQAKRGYRQMASAIPVADALQTVEELRHQKQDPKVIAQHLRGITTDPSMEEVPADKRQGLVDKLNGAADLFEQGKVNQGAARMASAARELDLETGDKPGSTVDYDPATMDSVSDVADGQQVEILRPPVTHVDPDTGKETVVSKGRVRPVGGAPEAVPTGIAETPAAPAAPEAPAAPAKVPRSKYTPDQERRLIDRAKLWRGQERNDEERRIVEEADKILARRGEKPGPTPERPPREGRAPMAKKAAAPAAPAPVKKAAAPEKKAAPKKLTGDRKPHTHQASNIIRDANEELANGLDPEQVAEGMREKADALLLHGENLHSDDLINPGRLERSDDDLKDIALGDSNLIHRMADDLEKQSAPPAKKAAPTPREQRAERRAAEAAKAPAKKAPAKKAEPNSFERELEAGVQRDNDTVNGWLKDSGVNAADLSDVDRTGLLIMAGNLEKKRLSKVEAGRQLRARGKKFDPIADLIDGTKAKRDKEEARKAGVAERAAARAAKKAATPAKKAAPAKDLTPEQQAAAEVQARADEAGLPNTVAELRAQAKEQGIRGFSTMRKELLQRALLGEDVSTGTTKLQVVSPEKMVGHLERVESDSAARTLLEKHTLKDLKALADQVGINHKERKLTTKDKLKTAILHEVRGAPGTDFEPVSPDEAISIRDLHIPEGDAGDMLRRGLVEVDDTSPESLRDESERLESHATQLRQRGDKVNAGLYQDAADRMGMRAQQISGMEEVPKPVKRAPRKAAAPKVKETAAETSARILAAPDEASAREALKGKTALELKAIADEVKAPYGSSWTKARIENSIVEQGVKRRLDGDAIGRVDLTPSERDRAEWVRLRDERDRALEAGKATKAAPVSRKAMRGMDATDPEVQRLGRMAYTRDRGQAVARVMEVVDNQGSPRAVEHTIRSASTLHDLSPAERDRLLQAHREGTLPEAAQRLVEESGGELISGTGEVVPFDRTKHQDIGPNTAAEGTPMLVVRSGVRHRDEGTILERASVMQASTEEARKFRAARDRAARVVPEGSMEGTRAQQPVTNPDRVSRWNEAWQQSGIHTPPGAAGRSMDEIRDDVGSGRITPEEGLRRLENDIAFNEGDAAEMRRELEGPSPDLAARKEKREKAEALEEAVDRQKDMAKFMREFFREEPAITTEEVKENLSPDTRSWLEQANADSSPESMDALRQQAREDGLGELEGNTVGELFADSLKKGIEKALRDREQAATGRAAKAAKKAATKKAAKAVPTVDPDNPRKLDAATIATGIDIREEDKGWMRNVQDELDAGNLTPGQIAKELETRARAKREMGPLFIGGIRGEGRNAEDQAELDRLRAQADRIDAMADRLRKMRRPAAKKAAPNPNLDVLSDDEIRQISESDKFTPDQRKAMLAELDARAARATPAAGEGRVRPGGQIPLGKIQPGDRVYVEQGPNGTWRPTTRKTGSTILTVTGRAPAVSERGFRRTTNRTGLVGTDENGNEIRVMGHEGRGYPGHQTFKAVTDTPVKKAAPAAKATPPAAPKPIKRSARDLRRAQAASQLEGIPAEQILARWDQDRADLAELRGPAGELRAQMLERALKELSEAKTESAARRALAGYSKKDLDFIAEKHGIKGRSSQAVIDQLVARQLGGTEMVSGEKLDRPRMKNTWGGVREPGTAHYHEDGPIGMSVQSMGEDRQLEVDGDTLGNTLDQLATDSVAGRISSAEVLKRYKELRDRMPQGSRARQTMDSAIRRMDTPAKAPLPLPDNMPAPIQALMQHLSEIPLARESMQRTGEPSAMEQLQEIAKQMAERYPNGGRLMWSRLGTELQDKLHGEYHESWGAEGGFDIDRAVRQAVQQLEAMRNPSPIRPGTAVGRAAVPGASTARRPVRPSLRVTRSPEEAAQVTSRQLRSITGRDIPVSFKGAMTEDAQQFGEALLSSMDDFPDVRLRAVDTYGHGGSAPHQSWMDEPEMKASLAVTDHLDVNGNSQILFNNDRAGVLPYLTEYSHQHGFLAGPGVPDIATHEFGHSLLSHLLEGHGDRPFDAYQVIQLIHRFAERAGQLKPIGYRSPDGMHHMRAVEFLASQISGYAAIPERGGYYNVQEIVAEAFTQVRLGRGSPLSRAIYDLLVKEYRRLGGSV